MWIFNVNLASFMNCPLSTNWGVHRIKSWWTWRFIKFIDLKVSAKSWLLWTCQVHEPDDASWTDAMNYSVWTVYEYFINYSLTKFINCSCNIPLLHIADIISEAIKGKWIHLVNFSPLLQWKTTFVTACLYSCSVSPFVKKKRTWSSGTNSFL